MTEYIDKAKVLEKTVAIKGYSSKMISAWDVAHIPSADVAEVKHGKWETNSDIPDTLICSVCKCRFDMWKHDSHRYCPNCGARMDGE